MIIDKMVVALVETRRRRWVSQGIVWSCVAAALVLPSIATSVLGRAPYSLAFIVVMIGAVLTNLPTTLIAAAVLVIRSYWLDRSSGSSQTDVAIRGLIFTALVIVTALGTEAFRRFQTRANATLTELQKSEALMRTVLETGPDAMLIMDADGAISRFSPAGELLFGWRAEEVVGRDISMLMPEPFRSEYASYLKEYRASGVRHVTGQSREVLGLRKDGGQFSMMLHVGEVKSGDSVYFTGFIHDLTELRDATQRTLDLRAQLAHVWSMHSLGEMAAVLAHELNQPLTAISNYVRGARTMIARLELADDKIIDALDRAGDQAIRAGEIIRRMRSLVTRSAIERKPESLRALIQEVDFMISLVAREAKAMVRYTFAEEFDEVLVDRIQIQQVVMNLVRNAAEAMRDTRWKILAISTVREAAAWVIRVEDSGPGMSSQVSDRLFQPMQSDKPDGMGLGLSICRTIVEAHGGIIWIEDSLLGGSAFCFRLSDKVESGGKYSDAPDGFRH
jgi:two-component system sensor kinase FixL